MLFTSNITKLLNGAVNLCNKAIKAANEQIAKSNAKTDALNRAIEKETVRIEEANRNRVVAEKLKAKISGITEETVQDAE